MRIARVVDPLLVPAGDHLFDSPSTLAATERFLADPTHHLLFAYADDDRIVGMVSGVETTHPDKGTEMFLYELGVDPDVQGRGIGTALVQALAELAKAAGCYGMWVGTEPDNVAALATYRRAGAMEEEPFISLTWTFGDSYQGAGS